MIVVFKYPLNPLSWTIYGLILGLVVPPLFYGIFEKLTICLYYKVLIWLGVVSFFGALLRCQCFIRFLNYLGDKAYGKRTIKG
jgi:hypothetical protein